jgi:hypothetical protein
LLCAATSAAHNGLLFLLQPFTVLLTQTRQAVCAVKQSLFLRCLWLVVKQLFTFFKVCCSIASWEMVATILSIKSLHVAHTTILSHFAMTCFIHCYAERRGAQKSVIDKKVGRQKNLGNILAWPNGLGNRFCLQNWFL